jgi:glucosamine--fructose-6-phosphate aminotransferase (isomerizing)
MAAEIAEQPDVLGRLLRDGRSAAREVAAILRARAPRFVLFAARGTSDHAALYAKYLVEIKLGIPAGLASPSTMTAYGAKPNFRDVLLVAVSQSGGSPDLVETTQRARECGALTLAVTNAPESHLARSAEFHIDVMAGPERAVAATKSYSAELMALWQIVDSITDGDSSLTFGLVDAAAEVVARRSEVAELASRYRFTDRLVVTGRGYSYPTAREAALKLMETTYIAAHSFSGADLLHGPLAMIDSDHPVVAIVPDGVGAIAMEPVLQRLRERQADVAVFGGAQSIALAATGIQLPHVPEELAPMVDIIALQWLCLEMALARGIDPDQPRGLSKVTQTW